MEKYLAPAFAICFWSILLGLTYLFGKGTYSDWRPFERFFHYSGIKFVFRKFVPKKDSGSVLPTGIVWFITLYFAIFAVTSTRYENKIDQLENQYNVFTTQVAAGVPFNFIKLKSILDTSIPYKSDFWSPPSVFKSFCYPKRVEKFYSEIKMVDGNNSIGLKPALMNILFVWKHSLENSILIGQDLGNAILVDAKCKGANFADANLSKANFRGANLTEASFENATLSGALLTHAICKSAVFDNSNMSGAHLNNGKFQNASFFNSDLRKANLSHAHFERSMFEGVFFLNSELREAKFNYAEMSNSNFYKAIFYYTDFSNADLIDAYFEGSNLKYVTFEKSALLGDTTFYNCSFLSTNFKNARIKSVNFKNVNFGSPTDEDNAVFSFMYEYDMFGKRQIKRANFEGANLNKVDFRGAKLKGVSFYNADIFHVDFEGADFEGVLNIEAEQLIHAGNIKDIVNCPPNVIKKIKSYGLEKMLNTHFDDWSEDIIDRRIELLKEWGVKFLPKEIQKIWGVPDKRSFY